MTNESTHKLAEKIALLLQEGENEINDFDSLKSSIESINKRLDKIENKLDSQSSNRIHSSSFIPHSLNHSSQEKFNVAEINADEAFENSEKEKACPYEPMGKPCDHCAMCSSRGF